MKHLYNCITVAILAIVFTLSTITVRAQVSYYVDGATGNDANNGTALTSAWKTIQEAFNKATPGSTVFIKGGTYNKELTLNVSGTVDSPIVFTNYQNDSVFIDGTGLSAKPLIMLSITDKSNVIFRNLVVQNLVKNDAVGIQTVCSGTGSVKNLTFKHILIRGIDWNKSATAKPSSSKNSQPFIAYGEGLTDTNLISNIVVDSCELTNNITGFSENLSFGGNISGITVTNNIVHDNDNIGIDFTGNYNECNCNDTALDHARNVYCAHNLVYNNISNYAANGGIYVDGGTNILIEKNICYNNGYGLEVGCEQNGMTYNVTVRDNLFYNNQITGMAIGGYDSTTTGIVINLKVYNNTFVANDYTNDGTGELTFTKINGCTIKNNVFYTNGQSLLLSKQVISPQVGLVMDYNDWFTPSEDSNNINVYWGNATLTTFASYRDSALETHSLYADPLLLDTSLTKPNFHLIDSSPCIDKGDPTYVLSSNETDFDGNNRIVNGRIDIGSYEYSPLATPVTLLSLGAIATNNDVLVNWHTATELNTSHFIIQHSTDGTSFIDIGTVKAIGSGANSYSFTDNHPDNGINYYRLESVDKDGATTYSKVVSASLTISDSRLTIYPNPAKDNVTISGSHIATVKVIDNMGRVVKVITLKDATNPTISVSSLPVGIYHLRIITSDCNVSGVGFVKE